MDSISLEVYKITDPKLKDAAWMDRMLSLLRINWRSIVNPVKNAVNKDWLFSRQSMAPTEALFKKGGGFLKNRGGVLTPLPICENIINLLIEDIRKAPPKAELTSNDPTAIREKKQDIFRLKNRKKNEADVNRNRAAVGLPPYKMPYNSFKGNVEEFDDMGLDDTDPDDINFFSGAYHTLNAQIAGQVLTDDIIKLQRFDEDATSSFVVDILADKVICMQVYVDQITGEIKYDYIYPETFYGIFGKRNDGTDDICNGILKSITVMEWLQRVGDKFDFERDWMKLLWGVNYRNGFTYTGFSVNNTIYDCFGNEGRMNELGLKNDQPNILYWTLAYTYELYMGYMEFTSPETTVSYKGKKGKDNRVIPSTATTIPPDYNITPEEEQQGYAKESKYQLVKYGANFIATSSVSQWTYGWGKVYHQTLRGANDEYSNGTLWYYRERGRSAIEIAMPYLQLANDAFYKMVWAVYEAHPDWEIYQAEELTELAKIMYSQAGAITSGGQPNLIANSIQKVIEYERQNLVKLRSIPRVDGKPMINLNNAPSKQQRGLDPIAIAMQSVCGWAEQQVMAKWGISDLRRAEANGDREGYKLNEAETQFSLNMTGYVYRMIQYMKERIVTSTVTLAQDIIKYKDTIPYNWIKTLIGDENFASLQALSDFAMHRLGIIVKDRNTQVDKKRILDAANLALDKGDGRGGLTFNQWFVVTQTEDYKKAAKTLDFLKMKADKKKRKQELQDIKMKQDHEKEMQQMIGQQQQNKDKNQMEMIKEQNSGSANVANINKEAKVDVKQMTVDAEPEKQGAKSESTKQVLEKKSDLEQQKPFEGK